MCEVQVDSDIHADNLQRGFHLIRMTSNKQMKNTLKVERDQGRKGKKLYILLLLVMALSLSFKKNYLCICLLGYRDSQEEESMLGRKPQTAACTGPQERPHDTSDSDFGRIKASHARRWRFWVSARAPQDRPRFHARGGRRKSDGPHAARRCRRAARSPGVRGPQAAPPVLDKGPYIFILPWAPPDVSRAEHSGNIHTFLGLNHRPPRPPQAPHTPAVELQSLEPWQVPC